MASYTITNNALGARGVGAILVEPGATVELELSEDEALLFSSFDDVEVTEGSAKPKRGRSVAETVSESPEAE